VSDVRKLSVREVVLDVVAECEFILEFTFGAYELGDLFREEDDEKSYETARLIVGASLAVDEHDGSVKAVEVRSADPVASGARH
jgi:hypothetical protein